MRSCGYASWINAANFSFSLNWTKNWKCTVYTSCVAHVTTSNSCVKLLLGDRGLSTYRIFSTEIREASQDKSEICNKRKKITTLTTSMVEHLYEKNRKIVSLKRTKNQHQHKSKKAWKGPFERRFEIVLPRKPEFFVLYFLSDDQGNVNVILWCILQNSSQQSQN